ncbi:MAG: arginine repressor [Candidatus Eiseniibacteriota bacterium]
MSRSRRLTALTQLLSERRFTSQEALARALGRQGHDVTQATLSRDLRVLGVGKGPGPDGATFYALPTPAVEAFDRARMRLDLQAFVNAVDVAENLVVVKTPPGHANGVGRAIDLLAFPGTLGSVAGDDTLLVVMRDTKHARRFKHHLDDLAAGNGHGTNGKRGATK